MIRSKLIWECLQNLITLAYHKKRNTAVDTRVQWKKQTMKELTYLPKKADQPFFEPEPVLASPKRLMKDYV